MWNKKVQSGILSLLLLISIGSAQGIGWGENTDSWKSPKTTTPWKADSLFIGASFLRDTTKPFRITLNFQEAGCYGNLYIVVPGGKTNGGDTSIYLFMNHDPIGTSVDLTNNNVVKTHIHHMDTLFFKYQVRPGYQCDTFPRYTGPNRAPGDGFTGTDRYWATDKVADLISSPDGSTHPIGRRWSVAGWIRNNTLQARTDTVQFGFEDLTPGDADYDDNVFQVTGVFLIRPATVASIKLQADPANDTIFAGDSVKYLATVLLDTVINGTLIHNYEDTTRAQSVSWSINGNPPGAKLILTSPNRRNIFTATVAYQLYTIKATIWDPYNRVTIEQTVSVYVKPNKASRLFVESKPRTDPNFNLNGPDSITQKLFLSTDVTHNAWAILRDVYGNYVSSSPRTTWQSGAPAIITTSIGAAAAGEGIMTKVGPNGTSKIETWFNDSSAVSRFHYTFNAIVNPADYDALRFVNSSGIVITAITIKLTDSIPLYAQARRVDGLGWEYQPVDWTLSPPLKANPNPPNSVNTWTYKPVNIIGTGTISIKLIASKTLTANLAVTVQPGGPNALKIFDKVGNPALANEYFNPPTIYSQAAGKTLPFAAKIFDPSSPPLWLSSYETAPANAAITWKMLFTSNGQVVDASVATLSAATGHSVVLTPKKAFTTIDVISSLTATVNGNQITLNDTVRVAIGPGPIDHLEITGDTIPNLNTQDKISRIDLSNSATKVSVYGVLRDVYNNFVKFADSTAWNSRDTNLVKAGVGPLVRLGEGLISRVTPTQSVTWVVASRGALKDSVQVYISSITYDALRIYVKDNGRKYITNMTIRTDQDTTLYVEGQRSDNKLWETVRSNWVAQGVTVVPTPPSLSDSCKFQPTTLGSGRMIAKMNGTSDTIRDTVFLTVTKGLPVRLTLYPKETSPSSAPGGDPTNNPLPDVTSPDTIEAGTPLTMIAYMFDKQNSWLDQYALSTAPITWQITEQPGNFLVPTGTISTLAGFKAVYTPTHAYNTVDIKATFNGQNSDVIRIYVKPAIGSRLSIEASPTPTGAKLQEPDKLPPIAFTKTDTIRYAYAVVRDKFGNWIGPSTSTLWNSLDPAVVKAEEAIAANGQGRIIRVGNSGATRVAAVNSANPLLTDTIGVALNAISYDSLRIVIGDSTRIDKLTLRTDQDTSIHVQGKRSDTGHWENVPGNWWITPTLPTNPTPPNAADYWKFSPRDTGNGIIVVGFGSSVPDTITVRFTPGLPASMALYPALGPVGGTNSPFPPITQPIIDTAGAPLLIVAKVFDSRGGWLPLFERSDSTVTWELVEIAGNPPTGTLSATSGSQVTFVPQKAWNTVNIIATFSEAGKIFKDTIQVQVVPGVPVRLVIESDQNPSRNTAAPLDSIVIPSNRDYTSVYAVLRDKFNNLVDYSKQTIWRSIDTTKATVANGNNNVGEGVIKRKTFGRDTIIATSGLYPNLTDSTVAIILQYFFKELKIVNGRGERVDSINISTNNWDSLYVMGLPSVGTEWIPVTAKWETIGGLRTTPSAPENAYSWFFSPDTAGNGFIRVTMGDDAKTTPDSIKVTFTRGKPTVAEMELITPPEQRIAGDTITAIVRIRNTDGPVPGRYCYSVATGALYKDTLRTPGNQKQPIVITSQGDTILGNKIDQCFNEGIDTVRFVLYHAPLDSSHNISVALDSLTASTGPFKLLPGPLSRIVIEQYNGKPIDSTVFLQYPTGSITMFSRGYDQFGNRRGDEKSNWVATTNLHDISKRTNTERIYYDASTVTDNESGIIIATAVDTSAGIKMDTVTVNIKGPQSHITNAITRDLDGDGYLDAVVFHFSKPVEITNADLALLQITYGKAIFVNNSIVSLNGTTTDTVFTLYFAEDSTSIPNVPQTSWRPYYSVQNLEGVDQVLPKTTRTTDGAGPVIWRVVKTIVSAEDRTKDKIQVIFSEAVLDSNGIPIAITYAPGTLFNVYQTTEGQNIVLDTTRLKGIENLSPVESSGDSILTFTMQNGVDLGSSNYFSINTLNGIVVDKNGNNKPVADNRRVRVMVVGNTTERVQAVPNPTRPNAKHVPAGQFNAWHEPEGARWTQSEKSGAIIRFALTLPKDGGVTVMVKVYDVVGNLVQSAMEKDILKPSNSSKGIALDKGSVKLIDLYWNGFNLNGMPVAPGIYRVVVYIKYQSRELEDIRCFTNIGIGK